MTAQVFRSGQSQTFYISDVLAPAPGGGVDGSFQNLNVARNSVLGAGATAGIALLINSNVAGVSPLELRGSAPSVDNGILISQTGFPGGPELGGFGVNTAEPSPSAYSYAYTGMDFKIGAGNVERLRLKFSGISSNTSASDVLALQPGSTTLYKNTLASGSSTPGWATISGWALPATVTNMTWQRVGNVVSCWGAFISPTSVVGTNLARFTLPVPRTSGAFTGAGDEVVSGSAVFRKTSGEVNSGGVIGLIGSSTEGSLFIASTAPADVGSVSISFAYLV